MAHGPLPRIDDRLAPPETRVEYLDGIELYAAPAEPPHATQHFGLTYVLSAHVRAGYRGAVDLLTRAAEASDFASETSIFPADPDLKTGGRKLEEIAFEVTDRQPLSVPTRKARELVARGVRRVFCIMVRPRRMLEWSRRTDGWETLPEDASIEDPVLVRPLPIRALLHAAEADDAVARALLAKHVPAIEQALAEREACGEARGEARGTLGTKRADILAVLRERGIVLTPREAARLAACDDVAVLDRWHRQSVTARTGRDALRGPRRQ